ncbi:MAG: PocR ligand-binding domain-containing protein, partial [Candidatus Omnitrophica bacterium]|nr:PocR ligand-binding domain-containing protein [Candidatus Omnitrophota bacterium]
MITQSIIQEKLRKVSLISLVVVFFIAMFGLISYIPGFSILRGVSSDHRYMALSTSIAFILLCIVIISYVYRSNILQNKARNIAAFIIGFIVSIFSLVKCLEYFFLGGETSFEQEFVHIPGKVKDVPIELMSPVTGAVFFIASIAVMLLILNKTRKVPRIFGNVSALLGAITFICGILYVLGYIYGQPLFIGVSLVIPMAFTTAIAFVFLGIGITFANGQYAIPLRFFIGSSISKDFMRIFLPLMIVAILRESFFEAFIISKTDIHGTMVHIALIICYAIITMVVLSGVAVSMEKKLEVAEKTTEESEARFKLIADYANDWEVFRDKDGKIIYSSPSIEKIIGYTKEEYIKGKIKLEDIIFPEDMEIFKENINIMVSKKSFRDVGIRLIKKNKEIIFASVSCQPIYDDHGNFCGSRASISDITKRVEAEKKLEQKNIILQSIYDELLENRKKIKEKEELLEEVCSIAKIGGWEMDLKKEGRAVWTKEIYDIVEIAENYPAPGYNEHLDFYLPQYRTMVKEKLEDIASGKDFMSYEAEFKTAKGNIRWGRALGKPIKEDGKVVKLRGTFQDITETKKYQEKIEKVNADLMENEARLKAKLEFIGNDGSLQNNVFLSDLIDVDALQKIQDAFAYATGVASMILDLKGVPITKPSNFSEVCNLIRKTEKGAQKCMFSDKALGERSLKKMRPEFEKCLSCGFLDASAPVIINGKPIAYWLIGQANSGAVDEKRIREYAKEIKADEKQMLDAFNNMHNISSDKFAKALDLLWQLAKEISTLGYNNLMLTKDLVILKKREEELKSLAKFPSENPNPILRVSSNGEILYSNSASVQMLKKWDALVNKTVPEDFMKTIKEAFQMGKNIEKLESIDDKFFIISIAPVPGEGYVNLYARDITAQKRTEKALEVYKDHLEEIVAERTLELELSNKELEAFSYSVSHDLRAPLRSMDGFSRILLETYKDKLDEEGKDNLMRVRNASKRMDKLIEDILMLSRVSRKELTKQRIDLSA